MSISLSLSLLKRNTPKIRAPFHERSCLLLVISVICLARLLCRLLVQSVWSYFLIRSGSTVVGAHRLALAPNHQQNDYNYPING